MPVFADVGVPPNEPCTVTVFKVKSIPKREVLVVPVKLFVYATETIEGVAVSLASLVAYVSEGSVPTTAPVSGLILRF